MPGLDLPSLAILMRQPPNRPDTVSHLASEAHTTVSMTNPADRVEIITSVQRRPRAGQRLRKFGSAWPRGRGQPRAAAKRSYRRSQVRELQWRVGSKTLEAGGARTRRGGKKLLRLPPSSR